MKYIAALITILICGVLATLFILWKGSTPDEIVDEFFNKPEIK